MAFDIAVSLALFVGAAVLMMRFDRGAARSRRGAARRPDGREIPVRHH